MYVFPSPYIPRLDRGKGHFDGVVFSEIDGLVMELSLSFWTFSAPTSYKSESSRNSLVVDVSLIEFTAMTVYMYQ